MCTVKCCQEGNEKSGQLNRFLYFIIPHYWWHRERMPGIHVHTIESSETHYLLISFNWIVPSRRINASFISIVILMKLPCSAFSSFCIRIHLPMLTRPTSVTNSSNSINVAVVPLRCSRASNELNTQKPVYKYLLQFPNRGTFFPKINNVMKKQNKISLHHSSSSNSH